MSDTKKGISWYSKLDEEEKIKTFYVISNEICRHLKCGDSIHLAKAKVRQEMGLGFLLMDYVARSSGEVLHLQEQRKQKRLNK